MNGQFNKWKTSQKLFYGFLVICLLAISFIFITNHKRTDTLPEVSIDINAQSKNEGVDYFLSFNQFFYDHVSIVPETTGSLNQKLIRSVGSLNELEYYSFQILGACAGGFGPPIAKRVDFNINNERDLTGFIKNNRLFNHNADYKEFQKLPFELKHDIVELYLSIEKAGFIFTQFAEPVKTFLDQELISKRSDAYHILIKPWKEKEISNFKVIDLLKTIDLKKLAFSSRIITEKLSLFNKYRDFEIDSDFQGCILETKCGAIYIGGTKRDTIANNYMLIVELGGDDLYAQHKENKITDQASIIIDFNGDDDYYFTNNHYKAGILSYDALMDLNGNDKYVTSNAGLAFALFGTSILFDKQGDDEYISKSTGSLAAAYIGSALFIDGKGNDKYSCKSYAQGFGGTLGSAIFIDYSGDDMYNTKEERMESTPSFIQGAACGRWAKATDGQSLAGGTGVFIDHTGNDSYFAGSFSQGASYYFGTGLFFDNQGDDQYNAISHSQGYGAHFALSCFMDEKGNDEYNLESDKEKITQIIGSGRDYSVGIFMDSEGDDVYAFGNRSAAVGDMNGIGIMMDKKGDDKYIWYKNNINSNSKSIDQTFDMNKGLEKSRLLPANDINTSLFLDTDGSNDYEIINYK